MVLFSNKDIRKWNMLLLFIINNICLVHTVHCRQTATKYNFIENQQ